MDNIIKTIMGLGAAALSIALIVFVVGQLKTALSGDEAVEGILDNIVELFSGFTSQFGKLGTIAGVVVLVAIIGLAGFWIYRRTI